MRTLIELGNFIKAGKGTQGYINREKIITVIRTVIMFTVSITIYFIGVTTLHTNKSIWTIIAVLGILPASKSAVGMIMFLRYRSIDIREYREIQDAACNIPTLYELVFTTKEKAFFVKACSCCMNTVILLADKNNKNKNYAKELERHLNDSISMEGINGTLIKIYTDKAAYIERLNEMNEKLYTESDSTFNKVFDLFLSITL